MAKILVADDNSNVQKTVALALADLGVEVVAVNNGDAAVKKLADVMPDLVLADIFMPVRNGYEVCEYIKKDSRFSHMPVVLLVGAFDPLDEREAQRVGADGILKKPFVPPDPLIAMVKTLLDRTLGERLVVATVSKSAVSAQSKGGGVAIAEGRPPLGNSSDEAEETEFPPPMGRLSFGEGERPVAFSQHLDASENDSSAAGTGVLEPVDDEQILTSSRDASLGDPIFWKTDDPEPENETENSETEDEDSSERPTSGWKLDDKALSGHAASNSEESDEPLVLVRDEQDEEASGKASTLVESSPLPVQDAASQASLTVESARPDDLAANPIEWMASVSLPPDEETPEASSEWNAAVTEPTDDIGAKESAVFDSASLPAEPEIPALLAGPVAASSTVMPSTPSADALLALPQSKVAAQTPDPHKTQPSLKPFTQSTEDTAHSLPKQDWTGLSASIKTKSAEPTAEKATAEADSAAQSSLAPVTPSTISQPAATNSAPSALKPLAQNIEDAARSMHNQDWTDLADSLNPKSAELSTGKTNTDNVPAAQPQVVPPANAQPASTNFAPPVSKSLTSTVESTIRSMPKLDWADLAAGLQPKPAETAAEKTKPTSSPIAAVPAIPGVQAAPAFVAPISAESKTSSLETLANTASANIPVADVSAANASSTSGSLTDPVSPIAPDPALVEAVVQRVLDKMRPQVVDIITKEFLRPVVQALVHREITKK